VVILDLQVISVKTGLNIVDFYGSRCLAAWEQALPEIINSDQGGQFASLDFTG